ncbi:hypothetical protein F4774DRAFT_347289 [Daldinia eschscholtzii]|nr:hypothetical protein F4774DRAFT_347289 [Daldinia eschscholtzii]
MPGPTSPTPEEAAEMLSRPGDDKTANIIVCCSISLLFATVFIGLRLWSRRVLNGRILLDLSDWFAIMAWVFYVAYVANIIMVTRHGLGRHIVFVTNPRLLSIYTIISENFYAVTLALLKFSVLCLYRKVFSSSTRFCRFTWVLTALVTEWMLQIILATNLQCIPISATWDPTIIDQSTCINYGVEALVAYVMNITTDLTILSMPIPLVLRLNTSKSQKRRLIIVFAAGGSACIVSLVQLRYITRLGNSSDPSWDNVPSAMLGVVEIMVGFLATSIATYRPLYYLISKGSVTENSGNSRSTDFAADGPSRSSKKTHFSTNIRGGIASRLHNSAKSPPSEGIYVTRDVELTEQDSAQGSCERVHDEVELLDRRDVR